MGFGGIPGAIWGSQEYLTPPLPISPPPHPSECCCHRGTPKASAPTISSTSAGTLFRCYWEHWEGVGGHWEGTGGQQEGYWEHWVLAAEVVGALGGIWRCWEGAEGYWEEMWGNWGLLGGNR